MTSSGRLVRSVSSGVVLAATVLGVPAGLLQWGRSPLPGGKGLVDGIGDLVSGPLNDRALFGLITVVLWLMWGLFAVSVVAELKAGLTALRSDRHPTRRVRFVGPFGLAAHRLVASLLMVGATTTASTAPGAVAAPAPVVLEHPDARPDLGPNPIGATLHLEAPTPTRDPNPPPQLPEPPPPVPSPSTMPAPVSPAGLQGGAHLEQPQRVVEVREGDSAWTIAQAHLGDGMRWRELFDANRGRPQPDGRTWDDPEHIEAGWQLHLPAAAAPLTAPAPQPHVGEQPASDTPSPEPAPAPEPPAQPLPPVEPTAATTPTDVTAPPATAPPATAPAATEPAAPPTTTDAPAPTSSGETAAPQQPAADADRHAPSGDAEVDDDGVAPVIYLGAPLLAAVVIWGLNQLRRQRMRRLPRGSDVEPPPAEVQHTERYWRAVADHEAAEWVDTTIRYLTWAIRGSGERIDLIGLRAGGDGIELLLAQPRPRAAQGFEAVQEGWVWRLLCEDLDDIRPLAASEAPYSPALVSLGSSEHATVLVDVERLGVISVDGDTNLVRSWLVGMSLELATAPWATEVDLRLVGGLTELVALDHVSLLDAGALQSTVYRAVTATSQALGSQASTQAARVDDNAEPWPPVTIVVADGAIDPAIVGAAQPGRGVAVVTAGPLSAAPWQLIVSGDGTAILYPHRLTVRLAGVDQTTARDTAALLASATVPFDGSAAEASPATAALLAPRPVVTEPVAAEVREKYEKLITEIMAPAEVEVVVLGPPEVTGWEQTPRVRSIEIIVCLAVHDGPIASTLLRDRIFPAGCAAETLVQAVARTRKALGTSASTGDYHLPLAQDRSYRLGLGVRSDWARFKALRAAAKSAPAPCEARLLRAALALVRGQPFQDAPTGGYGWADADGIATHIQKAVIDVAQRLSELAFAAGDAQLADWAARQGQRAVPHHEGLFCDRALAQHHLGDVAGIRAVINEAEASAREFDPLGELQPETQAFLARLLQLRNEQRASGEG